MSKFKKNKPEVTGIITSSNNPDRLAAQTAPNAPAFSKKFFTKKRIIIILVSVVVLAGLAVGGYLYYKHTHKPVVVEVKTPAVSKLTSAEQAAAYKTYNELISARKFEEARAFVLTMPIGIPSKEGLIKDIDYLSSDKSAKQQEYIAKEKKGTMTYQDALIVGDVYAEQGDTVNAKKYYTKAISLSESQNNPTNGDFKGRVQAKINAL